MSRTTQFSNQSYSERRGFLRMHSYGTSLSGQYDLGDFMDPRGIVSVYRQCDPDFLRLDFMHGGRFYSRQWEEYFGDRTIPRLARQFITDILEGIIS